MSVAILHIFIVHLFPGFQWDFLHMQLMQDHSNRFSEMYTRLLEFQQDVSLHIKLICSCYICAQKNWFYVLRVQMANSAICANQLYKQVLCIKRGQILALEIMYFIGQRWSAQEVIPAGVQITGSFLK